MTLEERAAVERAFRDGTLAVLAASGRGAEAVGAVAAGAAAEMAAVAGAALTSALTIRPLGPDPVILARSNP